jgi:hypothetical protein
MICHLVHFTGMARLFVATEAVNGPLIRLMQSELYLKFMISLTIQLNLLEVNIFSTIFPYGNFKSFSLLRRIVQLRKNLYLSSRLKGLFW